MLKGVKQIQRKKTNSKEENKFKGRKQIQRKKTNSKEENKESRIIHRKGYKP